MTQGRTRASDARARPCSELAILRSFPFDEYTVRVLTVEHNFTAAREPIRELLEAHGYRRQEAQWDDWYVKAPASGTHGP